RALALDVARGPEETQSTQLRAAAREGCRDVERRRIAAPGSRMEHPRERVDTEREPAAEPEVARPQREPRDAEGRIRLAHSAADRALAQAQALDVNGEARVEAPLQHLLE